MLDRKYMVTFNTHSLLIGHNSQTENKKMKFLCVQLSERCIFSVCSMPLRPVCRARPASTRKKNKNWWQAMQHWSVLLLAVWFRNQPPEVCSTPAPRPRILLCWTLTRLVYNIQQGFTCRAWADGFMGRIYKRKNRPLLILEGWYWFRFWVYYIVGNNWVGY